MQRMLRRQSTGYLYISAVIGALLAVRWSTCRYVQHSGMSTLAPSVGDVAPSRVGEAEDVLVVASSTMTQAPCGKFSSGVCMCHVKPQSSALDAATGCTDTCCRISTRFRCPSITEMTIRGRRSPIEVALFSRMSSTKSDTYELLSTFPGCLTRKSKGGSSSLALKPRINLLGRFRKAFPAANNPFMGPEGG
ncbi:hypothetical protein GQ600_24624 [Phytophthora cactorum]|nr:hypothetical protein GQ600_24624 [Phytophthora cactorum]